MCSQLPYAACPTASRLESRDAPSHTSCGGSRYEFAETEFRANKCAQKSATEVLELIVKQLVSIQTKSIYSRTGSNGTLVHWTAGMHRSHNSTHGSSGVVGRVLVEGVLRRTCLISAVLHCLATAVEVAHWPSRLDDRWLGEWMNQPGCFKSLPMCFRLLVVNELCANLPDTFHTVHLCSLIRLTQAVLELQPWLADRIEATVPKSLMPNTIWPIHKSDTAQCATDPAISSLTLGPDELFTIWSNALRSLPKSLAYEPLFKSVCLSTHWNCATTHSSHPVREQGALFLDVLSLALSAPLDPRTRPHPPLRHSLQTRHDLHPIWYQFVFATFASWGLFMPHLTRVVVTQICANLMVLTERILRLDTNEPSGAVTDMTESPNVTHVSESNLPSDYTLASLACLQGIYHAIFLPGGSASAAQLLRKRPTDDTPTHPSASQLAGFPHAVARAMSLAEALAALTKTSGGVATTTVVSVESDGTTTTGGGGLHPFYRGSSANLDFSRDLVTDAPIDCPEATAVTDGVTAVYESEVTMDAQNFSVTFTDRTKNLFDQSPSTDTDTHHLLQTHTELVRQLPTLLTALAVTWDAFNRFPLGLTYADDPPCPGISWSDDDDDETTPIAMSNVSCLTALGAPAFVRPAIRVLIEPIALYHPAAFLVNLAVAWPANLLLLSSTEVAAPTTRSMMVDSTSGPNTVLHLLTPCRPANPAGPPCVDETSTTTAAAALPLLPLQTSLLRFLTGYVSHGDHFGPILQVTSLIKQMRDLVKRPCVGITILSKSSTLTIASSNHLPDALDVCSLERKQSLALFATRVQTNLLHILYAWLLSHQSHAITPDLMLTLLRDLICMPVATSGYNVAVTSSTASSVTIPPVAVFLLVKIFHVFLDLAEVSEDRREQRELQELCHRLLESTASVAASSLKQPSWFRRNLLVAQADNDVDRSSDSPVIASVKPSTTSAVESDAVMNADMPSVNSTGSLVNLSSATQSTLSNHTHPHRSSSVTVPAVESFSDRLSLATQSSIPGEPTRSRTRNDLTLQAMELLAEHTAGFLDVVYRSEEKDRVPTFLTGLLTVIFPYLRVRTLGNSDRFTAASKILASLSSYQYTRRAWRREALDLFMEPVFFQMTPTALHSWNIIVDHLMTQDKNTFREALTRLAFSQPATLNLFASKEAEHDLRAACLKKLSYLVYASEPDQYAKAMPDFLERLTECLRMSQGIVPQIHAQVFIFARALIARMSAIQLTSLWPIVMPELMLVFKSLSQHIQRRCEETNLSNRHKPKPTELNSKEMHMYLGACKLLVTGILIPEIKAPQFAFYQWVFVRETNYGTPTRLSPTADTSVATFVPLIAEVSAHLQNLERATEVHSANAKGPVVEPLQGCLHVLSMKKMSHLSELTAFLSSLEHPWESCQHSDSVPSKLGCDASLIVDVALEAALAQEFPEPIAAR